MIKHFREFAASERTYLSWVRTALSIGAFGFLVDKYGIWVAETGHKSDSTPDLILDHAGILLMAMCIVVLVAATIRFIHTNRRIASESSHQWKFPMSDLLLGVSLAAIGTVVALLMLHVTLH